MAFSILPLDNPLVSKIRSVSLRFNFSELDSEPRWAWGATSTAEISTTPRQNPILVYRIVEGGHIKESWTVALRVEKIVDSRAES